jgi:hypothetical protein
MIASTPPISIIAGRVLARKCFPWSPYTDEPHGVNNYIQAAGYSTHELYEEDL